MMMRYDVNLDFEKENEMSCDLPTGKLFQKKILYVQHVNNSEPLITKIPISELKFNLLYNSLKLRDKTFGIPAR
jgi:hypothetical protein